MLLKKEVLLNKTSIVGTEYKTKYLKVEGGHLRLELLQLLQESCLNLPDQVVHTKTFFMLVTKI